MPQQVDAWQARPPQAVIDTTTEYVMLPKEAKELLANAMDLSHLYIDVLPDESIASYSNATLEISHATNSRVALKYSPTLILELPYLVAHESAHLIRMYSVPDESRLVPVTTPHHRAKMIVDSRHDFERFYKIGLPDSVIAEMLDFLYQGVVRQVTNFPADLRIERWLHRDYPGLRQWQERALRRQVAENWKAASRKVRQLTPRRTFRAANIMNVAYARYMSHLLQDRNLFSSYGRTELAQQGTRLADESWDSEDKGYHSDVDDSNEWAKQLGIDEWFEWRRLSEIQSYRV